ncbi:tyrosine-type recombinase/integrase [Streptodolium elevatio]
MALLVKHRAEQKCAREKAGEAWTELGPSSPSDIGTPLDPDNFSHAFSRIAKGAGLGHSHPHELRHSRASLMLEQGPPLHVVSEILGHAGIAITRDVYGHLVERGQANRGGVLMTPMKSGPRRHEVTGRGRSSAPKNQGPEEAREPNS